MEKGLVIKSTGKWCQVQREDGSAVECQIKGKFRTEGLRTTNPLAVGDWIMFTMAEDGTGVVQTIEDRKNYIIRKSTNLSKQAHIIASNIDRAWLVVTLAKPATSTGFIDRFLITAEAYHIETTILFNKIDVYDEADHNLLDELSEMYSKAGYDCRAISALNQESVAMLKEDMAHQVNLLSGHSGVGKSTLINGLEADLSLRTQEISGYHQKGKHTTTFAEMFPLSGGGFIIDTPGIKGFGLIDLEKEELSHYFPEMRELLSFCQFNNCVHINEPNCAIKDAVEKGEIALSRYESYWSVYHDDAEETYRGANH